jgi:hypothetical protein
VQGRPIKGRRHFPRFSGFSGQEGDMKNHEMELCIRNCNECHAICTRTASYLLGEGGSGAHVTLLLVCADICRVSADAMLRGAEEHAITCGACAEICARCAAACEGHAEADAQLRACAEACRRCAESCALMAEPA